GVAAAQVGVAQHFLEPGVVQQVGAAPGDVGRHDDVNRPAAGEAGVQVFPFYEAVEGPAEVEGQCVRVRPEEHDRLRGGGVLPDHPGEAVLLQLRLLQRQEVFDVDDPTQCTGDQDGTKGHPCDLRP